MRILVQRSLKSSVSVNNEIVGAINNGLVLLVGFTHTDTLEDIDYLVKKVVNLRKCKSLTSLSLYGNPIDHIKGYRHFIIEMCPLLEKLDSAVISENELDIIKFRGSRYGEVRGKNGKILKYPRFKTRKIIANVWHF